MADRSGNSIERYYAAKQRKRKARKRRIYVFLVLFCILAFIILSLTVFFNITDFQINGNSSYSKKEIITTTGLGVGDNLFRMNKFEIADTLTEQLPYISTVEIYRKLPTTLCIDVQETYAAYVVYHGGKYVLLSPELKVLEIREELPENVAYLVGVTLSEVTVGKTAVFEKDTTEQLLNTITNNLEQYFDFANVSAIDVSESYSLRLYYDDHRIKILLGNSDELDDKLILAKNTIEQNGLTEYARIDVTATTVAYYRILDEEEIDDPGAMLIGQAEANADKTYERVESTEEESES